MNKYVRTGLVAGAFFIAASAGAVCVENRTGYTLYYEIQNFNTGCLPKVKFHKGTLGSHQKQCHAHSTDSGEDWKVYRNDEIRVFKMEADGTRSTACIKNVTGILNSLKVSYNGGNDTWWCLDRHDEED